MAKVPAVYDVTFQGIPGYWSGFDISKVDDDQLYHPYLLQRMLAISADIPGAMIGGQCYHRPGIPCWKHNKRRQILDSRAYHLVMTNSLPWKITIFNRDTIYKWAIYTMAMLNNQRVSPVFGSRFQWVWDGFSQVLVWFARCYGLERYGPMFCAWTWTLYIIISLIWKLVVHSVHM